MNGTETVKATWAALPADEPYDLPIDKAKLLHELRTLKLIR
jgi:hypothetical protein